MICCGVDCGPCSGTECREKMVNEFGGCPAECNPRLQIQKELCSGCRTYNPDRLSKKEARKKKVEDRKKWR
jgi:hypothetical protein